MLLSDITHPRLTVYCCAAVIGNVRSDFRRSRRYGSPGRPTETHQGRRYGQHSARGYAVARQARFEHRSRARRARSQRRQGIAGREARIPAAGGWFCNSSFLANVPRLSRMRSCICTMIIAVRLRWLKVSSLNENDSAQPGKQNAIDQVPKKSNSTAGISEQHRKPRILGTPEQRLPVLSLPAHGALRPALSQAATPLVVLTTRLVGRLDLLYSDGWSRFRSNKFGTSLSTDWR